MQKQTIEYDRREIITTIITHNTVNYTEWPETVRIDVSK